MVAPSVAARSWSLKASGDGKRWSAYPAGDAPSGPADYAGLPLAHAWTGGVTSGGITCSYELSAPASVRLAVSASANMAAPSFGASAAGTKNKASIEGLASGIDYYWGLQIDGQLPSLPLGRLRTFPAPGSTETLKIAFASCAATGSDAITFEQIQVESPHLFVHNGDMHYQDLSTTVAASYQAAYRTVLGSSRQRSLYRNVPLAYVWDDHDFCGNDSSSAATGRATAISVYKEWVPHYALPLNGSTDPIYQTFTIGRARVFLLDTRSSYAAGSTRLGAAQKAQFFADLAAATEDVLVVAVGVPFVSGAGADTWFGVASERAEICNQLSALGITGKTILLAGDMHGSAFDNGTHSQYGSGGGSGPIVLHASPLDKENSNKGGPYSSGSPILDSTNQYGTLTITFGAPVTAVFRAYAWNGSAWVQRLTGNFTLS